MTDSTAEHKKSRVGATFATLFFLGCLGLGYYAWNLWDANEAKSARISMLAKHRATCEGRLEDCENVSKERAAELDLMSNELEESKARLGLLENQLGALSRERAAIEEQMREFKSLTDQFRSMIDTGKLKVSFRNGRIILQLPAAVLFPTGVADLSAAGKSNIAEVAKILINVPDRRFIAAGHTDNVPVVSERWKSNWELSSARAVTVVEELIKSNIKPERLSAAGFAETDPIGENDSKQGRQQNRRIEIIVDPQIPDLPTSDTPNKQ